MKNDTLFYNARIHTGLSRDDAYGFMLVKNGRITCLSDTKPDETAYQSAVDLGGKYVYPCLIDAHVHLLYTIVESAMGFNICEFRGMEVFPNTMGGIEKRLREFAAGKKKNELVVANNYIISAVDQRRLPTRTELDSWCSGRPAVIFTIDGHASALSTAMLKKIGVDPEGSDGILAGEANDRNMGKITDAISSAITLKVLAKGVANVENDCAAYGISHVGALEGSGDSPRDVTARIMLFLARRMELQVRIYFQYFDLERVQRFRKYQLHPRIGGCGDWEMDGATGAHSSAFRTPFRDTGTTAPCYYTQKQVDDIVTQADRLGYQVASHAIGECAIERITEALGKTDSGRLHRVEHGEFFNDEGFRRFKTENLAVIMQPGYAWIDKRFLHSYEQFLEPEICGRLCFKKLYDAGVCVCGSSDSPVQLMDPYLQMTGMTDFYNPGESVDVFQAFRCYTLNPARALLEDEDIGTLEVGKEANFFVAGEELFDIAPERLNMFRPEQTYYGGRAWKPKSGTVSELIKMSLKRPHKV
jgi:predicted amidohydrolase YtcJ